MALSSVPVSESNDTKTTTTGSAGSTTEPQAPLKHTLSRAGSVSKKETPEERINKLLKQAGILNPEDKSYCLRAGMAKGFYQFTGKVDELNKVIWSGKCLKCKAPEQATLKQLLDQPDDGLDHGQGKNNAVVICGSCKYGFYLSRLCEGKPERDSGKFHGHCKDCRDLGICTRNAQNLHCERCHQHFDGGILGTEECPCKSATSCCVIA